MKRISKLIIFLIMFLISIVGVKAYDQTFNVTSSVIFGEGTSYAMGEMTTPNGDHAYCLSYGAPVPPNGTTYTFSKKVTNQEVVGATHRKLNDISNADRQINVYVVNRVIWDILEDRAETQEEVTRVKGWLQTISGNTYSYEQVKNIIQGEHKGFIFNAETYSEKSNNDTLSLSTSNLKFTKSGDYFVSNISMNVFNDYFRNLSDFSCTVKDNLGTCTINNENIEVKIPISSITQATTNISISVDATLTEKVAYEYTATGYQTLSVAGEETSTISKSASGSIKAAIINVTKVNKKTGEALSGAHLKLTDSKKNEIDNWYSSSTNARKIIVFETGKYYIYETSQLNGFFKNPLPVIFNVNTLGKEYNQTFTNFPIEYPGATFKTFFYVSKIDSKTKEEIEGAKYKLLDKDGNLVPPEQVIGKYPTVYSGLDEGKYCFVETIAPIGYVKNKSKTCFILNETGLFMTNESWEESSKKQVDEVILEDEPITLTISKQDITNKKELPGATLKILDSKRNLVVEPWVSTDTPHVIERIPAGEYVLVEVTAPDGYDIAEEKKFEVKDDGSVNSVIMYNSKTVETKVDVEDTAVRISIIIIGCGLLFIGLGAGVIYILKKRINVI